MICHLLVGQAAAQGEKPALVVLPVESVSDENKLGAQVRHSLTEKFLRTYEYEVLQPEDVDEAAARAGFRLTSQTPASDIVRFAGQALHCRYVFWGFCTRQPKGWIVRVLGLDLEESADKPAWDLQEHVTTDRELVSALNRFAEQITGYQRRVGLEPEVPEARRNKAPRPNLVPNPGFEEGRGRPAGWQTIDNLTTFWDASGGNPGRCLRVDTDVLDDQAMAWRKAVAEGADFRKPPAKQPTRPPQYDTIAGLHGVHFPSDPIPVKRGVVYRITADLKGPEGPKVWTKGYVPFQATGFAAQDREFYRNYLSCRGESGEPVDAGNGYTRYTRTCLPNPFYCVFDLEDRAGDGRAARATDILRETMRRRNFPLIPLEEQRRRLAKVHFTPRYEAVMPELVVNVRDRLLCAHAVYGKVERTEKGPRLFLRLMSTRIKRNVPILDLDYSIADEADISKACNQFLSECERALPFVRYVRVIPYPYWPPATYRFDNITLTEEGDTLW